MIKTDGLSSDEMIMLENEIKIMQEVDHQHIAKYYESYYGKNSVYLCMELCTGGDLY